MLDLRERIRPFDDNIIIIHADRYMEESPGNVPSCGDTRLEIKVPACTACRIISDETIIRTASSDWGIKMLKEEGKGIIVALGYYNNGFERLFIFLLICLVCPRIVRRCLSRVLTGFKYALAFLLTMTITITIRPPCEKQLLIIPQMICYEWGRLQLCVLFSMQMRFITIHHHWNDRHSM